MEMSNIGLMRNLPCTLLVEKTRTYKGYMTFLPNNLEACGARQTHPHGASL